MNRPSRAEVFPDTMPTEHPAIILARLAVSDANAYYESVDNDRPHLSQFDDKTAGNYPNLRSVINSIEYPLNPEKVRYGIWEYHHRFAGTVSATPQESGKIEIGYWLDKRFEGNGYATFAAKAIALHARQYYSQVRAEVYCGTNAITGEPVINTASASVLRRAGFGLICKRQKPGRLVFEFGAEDYE